METTRKNIISSLKRIAIPTRDAVLSFAPEQIIRLEALSNYTYIHFTDRKPLLMAKVLREYELLLKPFGFIRTHRSHLVNQQYIRQYDFNGTILMSDKSHAEVSRRKKREVYQSLTHQPEAA